MGNCYCNLTGVEESLLEESELLSQSNAMRNIIAPIRVDLKVQSGMIQMHIPVNPRVMGELLLQRSRKVELPMIPLTCSSCVHDCDFDLIDVE